MGPLQYYFTSRDSDTVLALWLDWDSGGSRKNKKA
jgi:hypothetical protein